MDASPGDSDALFAQFPDWVQKLAPHASAYADERSLAHYERVARALHERFGERPLTTAGLLHGARVETVRALGLADATTMAILEDYDRLLGLKSVDMTAGAAPIARVLPRVGEAAAIPLFILEQVDRLDPDGQIERWTMKFHREPCELPDRFARGIDTCVTPERLAFVRRVLVPAARHWGFWAEANVADDAASILEPGDKITRAVKWVLDNGRRRAELHVECVREALGGALPVHWEWHHAATIQQNLASRSTGKRPWRLHRCGFVTVPCRTAKECYRTLGVLHRQLEHRPADLRDFIGRSSAGGYAAIHTVVSAEIAGERHLVAVRIIPKIQDQRRFSPTPRAVLESIRESLRSHERIVVFTRDGEPKRLKAGATVLNFALSVHADMVARVRGAQINRDYFASPLHVLEPGDEVDLVLSDEPTPLPQGWERRVPASTVKKIRTALGRAHREASPRVSCLFHIKTTNRVGIVHDLLSVFRDVDGDVVEIVGRRLGPYLGVTRIEADHVKESDVPKIREKLAEMHDVSKVYGLDDSVPLSLQSYLPPRVDRDLLASRPLPYIAGPAIVDDRWFYGRKNELATLYTWLAQTCEDRAKNGVVVFLNGPFKTGKSSIAMCFERELQRVTDRPIVTAYHTWRGTSRGLHSEGEPWTAVQQALRSDLVEKVVAAGQHWGAPVSLPAEASLSEVLVASRRALSRSAIVVVLDEVVGALSAWQWSADEVSRFQRFVSDVAHTPGVMLVLIGPCAPIRLWPQHIAHPLASAHQLTPSSFNVEDTGALVRAVKFGPAANVRIIEPLVQSLRDMAGGNVYWIQQLAKKMWECAAPRRNDAVVYDDALLQVARTNIVGTELPWKMILDCYGASDRHVLVRAIIRALSAPEAAGGITVAETMGIVSRVLPHVREQTEELLLTLVDQGAALRVDVAGERPRFRVAAPILADYVRARWGALW